jgi:hypothetical protein
MRVVVGWFKCSRDAYLEAYEVDDEEFWRVLEEASDDNPRLRSRPGSSIPRERKG